MRFLIILLIIASCFASINAGAITTNTAGLPPGSKEEGEKLLANSPVLFRENKGQLTDANNQPVPFVLFKTVTPGVDVYITTKGITYVFSKFDEEKEERNNEEQPKLRKKTPGVEASWVNMHLEGASIRSENIIKEGQGRTSANFFYPHCPDGIYGVKEYEKITVKDVYPGIDWVLYGSSTDGMKYDFIVNPGADAARIRLLYEGEFPVSIDEKGNIKVSSRLGTLTENAPVSYTAKEQKEVKSHFKSERVDKYNVRVTYSLGSYPKDEALVIDPQLKWGTRFGANGPDGPMSVTHDNQGNIFIAGYTASPAFPVLNAGTYYQPNMGGPSFTAFILKFNNTGVLLWATFYGGSTVDVANSIICDTNGNVFVTGQTSSANFPLQNAGTYFQAPAGDDIFILKFDNAGNRLWATCYGGGFSETAHSITCDPSGNIFVTGYTLSPNFPVQNAGTYFQPAAGGIEAFILKFDNTGNRLWATYYGGDQTDIAYSITSDPSGNIFVTGYTESNTFPVQNTGTYFQGTLSGSKDVFFLKFDNAGNRLWATYYGGNGAETGQTVLTDQAGNLFATGNTASPNFPVSFGGTYFDGTLSGPNDAFILKFDNAGTCFWATYFGGSGSEVSTMTPITTYDNIAIDSCGYVYVSLVTTSTNMSTLNPGCGSYFDGTFGGGSSTDVFLARFNNIGDMIWGTYLGDSEYNFREALETVNTDLFMTGEWGNYPSTGNLLLAPGNGAYYDPSPDLNEDGYIFKFSIDPPTVFTSFIGTAGCNCLGQASVGISCQTGPFTYTWSNGDQVSSMIPSCTNLLCAGNHWVEITSCGSRDTVFFTIPAEVLPTASFTASDTVVCQDECLNFSTTVVNGNTYAWDFGDGATSTQATPSHCYTQPGSYDVSLTVTDASGCTVTSTAANYIDVLNAPVAALSANPVTTGISFPTISFKEQATGEIGWHWTFGDMVGGESFLPDPAYTYTEPGEYLVTLVVANATCTDTVFITIYIEEEFAFYAPNAFTPTGDGLNDEWLPKGAGIDGSVYELYIFNRWGDLIWKTGTLGEGWNGKGNGGKELAPVDVYIWKAVVKSESGETRHYTGHVSLIR